MMNRNFSKIATLFAVSAMSLGMGSVANRPLSQEKTTVDVASNKDQNSQAVTVNRSLSQFVKHQGYIPTVLHACQPSPIFFGKSQKGKKTNKINRSHKTRLKHRKSR